MKISNQLTLPIFDDPVPNAVVEVVLDAVEKRARVRPVGFTGWVRFPNQLRIPGTKYIVELLKPRPGGAWAATGKIIELRNAETA